MTPDIREKAERLADKLDREAVERPPAGDYFDVHSAANIISQALLEAHNAGRAEERERCVKIAEHYEVYQAAADMLDEEFTLDDIPPEQAAELREIVSNTLATEGVQEAVREANALLSKLNRRSIT